jgi:hypothetical protein
VIGRGDAPRAFILKGSLVYWSDFVRRRAIGRLGLAAIGCCLIALPARAEEAASAAEEPGHANPVYQALTSPDADPPQLPPAALIDGQSAAEQRRVLTDLIGKKYSLERFLRPSVYAPHRLQMERERRSETEIAMQVDIVFAAAGKLDTIANPQFLNSLVQGSDEEAPRELTDAELQAAGIDPAKIEPDHEFYHWVKGELFDRVKFQGVVHTFWTQTEDSILLAMRFDPRFDDVSELQPRWQRYERAADGSLEPVEAGAFTGGGLYIKMNRWAAETDRLVIEARLKLIEPQAWFRGANLLGAKLPPAIQSQVREIRGKALRAMRDAD